MNYVTPEQIKAAKSVPLLDYLLSTEPDNVRKVGKEYRLRDHDSLAICNGKFNWHSQNIGGSNAIDYLTKVRGLSFVEAVQRITGERRPVLPVSQKQECKPRTFTLPEQNVHNDRVIDYLTKRKIAMEVITDCIQRGMLYEDTRHNCVFVSYDDKQTPRYAALRGTYGDFKCETSGSDKRYSFLLPPVNSDCQLIAVFESPIDALSHKTLCTEYDGWRLSLGGTALTALVQFLTLHPDVRWLDVCTDNDDAGNDCFEKIKALNGVYVLRCKPPCGKDWNESLQGLCSDEARL
jgi:hypothetical protein